LQSVGVDIETKVLNDLDDKLHRVVEAIFRKPGLVKLIDKTEQEIESEELAFAYRILYMCAHAFHMHQRKVLRDNE
jgi:hypothetical protein